MKGSRFGVSVSLCALTLALPAMAQNRPPSRPSDQSSAAAADKDTVEDIVVTAQREESTVQKTPLSIDVVGGDALTKGNVLSLANLTQVEPTVVFNQGQFNGASATIRGISTNGGNGAAVVVDVDGQYILVGFNPALYDVARIEVLKGPQGTLYGLNSTGGAINIITNAPKLGQYSLDTNVAFGNYNERTFGATANLPLSDTLALRVAGFSASRDGYRTHPGIDRTDLANTNAVRGSLLWQPTSRLKANVTLEYAHEDFGGAAQQGVLLSPTNPLTPAGVAPTQFTVKNGNVDPFNWTLNYQGYNVADVYSVRSQISYDMGFATLTNLADYRRRNLNYSQPAFGTPIQTTDYGQVNVDKVFQEELRLNGYTSFGTKWQVGGFYLDHTIRAETSVWTPQTAAFAPPRTIAALKFYVPANIERISAAYGQVTQTLFPGLTLTGGLRYTAVYQSNYPNYIQPLIAGANPPSTVTYGSRAAGGSLTYRKFTYKAGLEYQATPSNLLYASVSTGFKDGGFTAYNSFSPEDITAYEIGAKNRFMNGRLQINAAAFYYKYNNQQFGLFVVPPGGGAAYNTTVNAGASSLKGAEITATWLATSNDRLTGSVNYLHGRLGEFVVAESVVGATSTGATSVNADLKGNVPPQAPEWTLTAAWDHTWRLDNGAEVGLSADVRYMTSYYLGIFNWAGQKVSGFEQSNAQLSYTAPGGKWEAAVFVKNIENNTVLNFAQYVNQGGANIYQFGWAPPRTFGARIAVHLR